MESARQSGTPFYFVAQECHVGYDRLVNEDAIGSFTTPNGELFIVADGLSGQAGDGVASRLAMGAFQKHLMEEQGEPAELMRQAVARADQAVIEAGQSHPELAGLGSSLVALLLKNNEAWYINVGNSRLYLFSALGLKRLTRSVSPEAGFGGAAPRFEADGDSLWERAAAPQALGGAVDIAALRPGRHFYKADDTFLLASSGLQSLLDDREIREIMAEPASPEDRARALIEAAVKAEGSDNISLQLVAFKPGPEEDDESSAPAWLEGWRGFFAGLAVGLAAGAALMYFIAQ